MQPVRPIHWLSVIHFGQAHGVFWRVADALLFRRKEVVQKRNRDKEQSEIQKDIAGLVPDFAVQAGPFKGLKYLGVRPVKSSLAPKLLGTYEAELHQVIGNICESGYSIVISTGCAEGYYAVGFAKRLVEARVFAYDDAPLAREFCLQLAIQNEVADRVVIGSHFTMRSIPELRSDQKGLLVSDCDGAERHIFYNGDAGWQHLRHFDLLIEVHEFANPGISRYLLALFSATHHIERILSIEDVSRPKEFECSLLEGWHAKDKIRLMAEHRPGTTEWLIMRSKAWEE